LSRARSQSGEFEGFFTPERIAQLRILRGVEGKTGGEIARLWGEPFTANNIYSALAREGIKGAPLAPIEKYCALPSCGLRLERREGENRQDWKRRKYCCSAHANTLSAQLRRAARATLCQHCKKNPVPYGEQYCSYGCRQSHQSALAVRRKQTRPFTGHFETVDEYLARGGHVDRIEPQSWPMTAGIPVYPTYPKSRGGGR
jgi:hypothetical protein